jgi:glutaredoxin
MLKEVQIYTTASCPWCKKAKAWLTAHQVGYQEFDVSYDKDRRGELIRLTHQLGVPVVVWSENNFTVGFNERQFAEKLVLG